MILSQAVVTAISQAALPHKTITEKMTAGVCVQFLGDYVRYDRTRRLWLKWVKTHWSDGHDHEVRFALYEACSLMAVYGGGGALSAAERKRLGSERFARAVETIMRNDALVSMSIDDFDADPWLLGTPGGTVDLRTGTASPAAPEDYITKLSRVTPAPPGTPTPMFDRFLNQVTGGDRDVQEFLLTWFGISATGTVTAQHFVFIHGPGGNGKGVLLRTVARLLGPAAIEADAKLFIAKRNEAHPTGLARLQGARMVIGVEVPKNSEWDTELWKRLTGGDDIVARYMHRDFFTFRPRLTITITGNSRPGLDSVDNAIKRRILLVPFPFTLKVEEQIGDLEEKLIAAEGPGILRKIVDAAAAWHQAGGKLVIPPAIVEASAAYLEDEDLFGAFVREACELVDVFEDPTVTPTAEFYERYTDFCRRRRKQPDYVNAFALQMAGVAGVKAERTKKVRGFSGIKLLSSFDGL